MSYKNVSFLRLVSVNYDKNCFKLKQQSFSEAHFSNSRDD